MKLFKVPRGSWVKVGDDDGDTKVPPSAPVIDHGQVVFFDHLDGMYSYCKDQEGNVVHLAAWAEVEIVDNPKEGDSK